MRRDEGRKDLSPSAMAVRRRAGKDPVAQQEGGKEAGSLPVVSPPSKRTIPAVPTNKTSGYEARSRALTSERKKIWVQNLHLNQVINPKVQIRIFEEGRRGEDMRTAGSPGQK